MNRKQDVYLQNPTGHQINAGLLQEFERGLNPASPGDSKVPARILGYGEISTVFEIQIEELRGLAFKRLSIFETLEEVEKYLAAYKEYSRLLEEEIGIRPPANGYVAFVGDTGRPILYIVQKMLPSPWLAHKALHALPVEQSLLLVKRILRELRKVWDFNRRQSRLQVALDGQLSNWAIENFDPAQLTLDEQAPLLYLDTSTPLFRIQGNEQLDPELFLRNAPSFLAWLIRLLFLKDVVNRYYDFHLVAVDLLANVYKEQKAELIPDLVRVTNEFFAGEAAELGIRPVEEKEVQSYYREDAFIWSFYLSARRLDRFLRTRLLRREYPYILPGKIKR
jgi:hypothetical protein